MRLDLVLPRYGTHGGAEVVLASLARELTNRRGWRVEVHTTCATSASTWRNEHEPGPATVDSITVHRHKVDSGRTREWESINEALELAPTAFDQLAELDYLVAQGPVSRSLEAAVADSDADLVLFKPYLYWTTAIASLACKRPRIIWPAAHDEAYIQLGSVGTAFEQADGLVFGTEAERRLVHQHHRVAHLRQLVLGCGIDIHPGEPADAVQRTGIDPDRPWVLYLGRIEQGKGAHRVRSLWREYCATADVKHQLVMAGENVAKFSSEPGIAVVGEVDEATKWGLLRGADLLIHPSHLESFGMVVTEAWAAGIPVLVNGRCDPTYEHVRHSGGGMWFITNRDFAAALSELLPNAELRAQLAQAGRSYAQERYNWENIVGRFSGFCERVVQFSPRALTS